MSGIGSRVLQWIEFRTAGAAQAASQYRQVGVAMQGVNRQINNQSRAMQGWGRTAQHSGIMYSSAMQGAAQSTFRYTFYALMAIRVGQMLLSKVFIKGMSEAAEKYTYSWAKIRGILQAAKEDIVALTDKARELALTTPFGPVDITESMGAAARAGLGQAQIMATTEHAAHLATLGEIDLTEATEAMITTARAYNIAMEDSAKITDIFAYFETKGIAKTQDFISVLGKAGTSAAAYNQALAQTLQLAQALVSVGNPAEEVGTLMRQLYTKGSTKEVQMALQAGLRFMGLQPLYTEQGQMRNIGEAYIGFAKLIQEAVSTGKITGSERDQLVEELFGVRQARGFLSLSRYTLEKYRELYDNNWDAMLEDAHKALEERLAQIRLELTWTKQQFQATRANIANTLGVPINQMIRPLYQVATETVAFTDYLINMNETTRSLIPAMLGLGAAIIGMAGAVGLGAGLWMLLKTRVADFGQEIAHQAVQMQRLRSMGYFRGIAEPSTARVGFAYFRSRIRTPLKILAGVSLLGGLVAVAWKNNLWNLQGHTKKFLDWWRENMNKTGSVAEKLAGGVKSITGHGTPLGTFLRGFAAQFKRGGAMETIGNVVISVAKGLGWALRHFVIPTLKVFGVMLSGLFKFAAFSLGVGDVSRGIERFGMALGWLITLSLVEKAGHAIMGLSKVLALGVAHLLRIYRVAEGETAAHMLFGGRAIRGHRYAIRPGMGLAVRAMPGFIGRAGRGAYAGGLNLAHAVTSSVQREQAKLLAQQVGYRMVGTQVLARGGRPVLNVGAEMAALRGARAMNVTGTTTEAFLRRQAAASSAAASAAATSRGVRQGMVSWARTSKLGAPVAGGWSRMSMMAPGMLVGLKTILPWLLGAIGIGAILYLIGKTLSAHKTASVSTGMPSVYQTINFTGDISQMNMDEIAEQVRLGAERAISASEREKELDTAEHGARSAAYVGEGG